MSNIDSNPDTLSTYLNQPCPKCGSNLLTVTDFLSYMKMLKTISWINRWFSWLTIFSCKKGNVKSMTVHHHDGIHITEK